LIGYYLPDIQLSQRGRIEKISIKVAGSIYRACEQASIMAEHVFHNTKVIDKSNHWSLLLYQESLAIQRYKPELNHGLKASKELIIFN
jgi:hypothetical protein